MDVSASVGIGLGLLGIVATVWITCWVDRKSSRLFRRIELIQTAEMTMGKYKTLLRFLDEAACAGNKEGRIYQRGQDWLVEWTKTADESLKIRENGLVVLNNTQTGEKKTIT